MEEVHWDTEKAYHRCQRRDGNKGPNNAHLCVVYGLVSDTSRLRLNLRKVPVVGVEARRVVEDGRHDSQPQRAPKRNRHGQQPNNRRPQVPVQTDAVQRRRHEPQAAAQADQGHHDVDGGQALGVDGPAQQAQPDGLDERAQEDGRPRHARPAVADEGAQVHAGAEAREEVQELDAGLVRVVAPNGDEVDVAEVEDLCW